MKKRIFSIVIVLLLCIAFPVSAKEINKFHTVANDNVSFKDTVKGDSAIAGNLVDIIGSIDGIGFIAGNTVNVNGDLEYGFVAGNTINVNGNISKNIYAAGNSINISKDAKVERDAFIMANEVIISGELNRDVSLGATSLTIKSDAKINGNVTIDANKLIVEEGASIEGILKYNSDAKVELSNDAKIGNVVIYDNNQSADNNSNILGTVISVINMLVVFAIIYALFPRVCDNTISNYDESKNYLKNFGIGLLVLFCVPIICILLLISSIGLSLGLILGVLYAVSIYLAFIISGFILGDLIITKLFKQNISNILVGFIGIIVLQLLMIVPYIGSIIGIIALPLGLGTIFSLVFIDGRKKDKDTKIIEAKTIKNSKTKKN